MSSTLKEQLVDKYAPKTIDEMALEPKLKTIFNNMIEKRTVGNMLLFGCQGIGKTTLMNIVAKGVGAEILYIPAAYENTIDVIRGKVIDFCQTSFPDASMKIVMIDEFDSMKGQSTEGGGISTGTSAQGSLKNVIEEHSDDTRFILTCNNINKVIDPIKSRCVPVALNFTRDDVVARIVTILKKEGVDINYEVFKEYIKTVVIPNMPDIRVIINTLEYWIEDGILVNPRLKNESKLSEIIDLIISVKEPKEIRTYLLGNEDVFHRDYQNLASSLFERLIDDQRACVIIADSLYRMAVVKDEEIQFHSMIIRLKHGK